MNWIREYVKSFFTNFIINASLKGSAIQEEVSEKNNCNVPWAILSGSYQCSVICTAQDAGQQNMAIS